MVSHLQKAFFAALVALVACMLSLMIATPAWADSYNMALQTDANSQTVSVGGEFTVNEMLTDVDASEFTMYALSSQLVYDTTKLQLTQTTAGKYGVATNQNNTVVYNALSGPFAGTIISNPLTMCSATFKVLAEGDSTISFKRASVSTYSGMHSFPVSTTGLTVSATIQPSASEQTEPGTATESEAQDSSVNKVKENTSTIDDLLENGTLTKEVLDNAYKAGFSDEDLKALGVTQEEIDRANNGETIVPGTASESSKELAEANGVNINTSNTSSANNTNGNSTNNANSNNANNASKNNTIPVVPVVVVVVIIVAAVIGVVVYRKSKKDRPTKVEPEQDESKEE